VSIRNIYIDRGFVDHPETEKLISRLPDAQQRIVSDASEVYAEIEAAEDPVARGKEILFLTANRGAFVRPCPGTREYTCCGYWILHVGSFCTMDCSYCILQAYFHPPVLQYFINGQDLKRELHRALAEGVFRRIGTGEFTDSLIWELWTDRCRWLVDTFGAQHKAVLELKTKTVGIEFLREADHQGKTVMAWSLNTPRIIRSEERGTASLAARLRAAEQCQKWGYPVAFHFDPLVIYPDCDAEYREVVRNLFSRIPPDSIAWISLGSFRFMPALKALIQKRFPESKIVYGEFLPGLDGKMRYFRPLRLKLYQAVVEEIRRAAPDATIYFCMEDEGIWNRCLGIRPSQEGGLDRMLDRRVKDLCGLDP